MRIIERPSPNHGARPDRASIDAIVLHGTAGTAESDLSWLCNADSRVSYHYLIDRDGQVYRLVDEERRAWHANPSEWDGRPDLNDWSIGVGLSNRGPVGADPRNPGQESYPSAQLMAAAELLTDICDRHGIPWRMILTHAQVSPGRKHDPWLHFPIGEFAGAMLSYQGINRGPS